MLLSQKTTIEVNDIYANIIGHMCYAAYKLWNVCNYERRNYKELGLTQYPDWFYQKQAHKDNMWFKQLPSQTSQEVCKLLDKAWKSFYKLMETGGIENPHPPKFKHNGIAITYMQNAIKRAQDPTKVRLTISKDLKAYMSKTYGINEDYLYLENQIFRNADNIKQIKIYPPVNGVCEIIVVYETPDVLPLGDNGKYLTIDLGVHNFMTCLNSVTGESFIVGRKYLSLCRYYNKEIARVQSQWYSIQSKKGVQYPKTSKHIQKLYTKRNNSVNDYLHKMTRYIVNYCKKHDIHTVVIGDITGIRKDKDMGHVNNQNFHALPYKRIYELLKYKLASEGIAFIMQKEAYSSQCSPLSPKVSKRYAKPQNRVKRGLYKDAGYTWNADCVGAYNILRLYLKTQDKQILLLPKNIKQPYIAKVAV